MTTNRLRLMNFGVLAVGIILIGFGSAAAVIPAFMNGWISAQIDRRKGDRNAQG